MRKINIVIILLLTLISNNLFSQKALDKASNETCDCMKKATVSDNITPEEYQELITTCLTAPLTAYYDKICKELKIANNHSDGSYQEVGSKIAAKLIENCPRFMQLSVKVEENKTKANNTTTKTNVAEEKGKTATSTGVIKLIEKKDFYFITIENTLGSKEKFIWLRNFKGSSSFENNPMGQKEKNVTITYRELMLFSADVGEYIIFKEIIDLKFND